MKITVIGTGYVDSQSKAIDGVDAYIICTEWSEFRNSDLTHLHIHLDYVLVSDGGNIFETEQTKKLKLFISV